MTATQQNILDDFYQGNAKSITVTTYKPDGSRKDLTNATVTYGLVDLDDEWVIRKSSSEVTQIEITDAANGVFVVYVLPADTLGLYGDYIHHANVIDVNGDEETVMVGRVRIFKAYAQRYSIDSVPAFTTGG